MGMISLFTYIIIDFEWKKEGGELTQLRREAYKLSGRIPKSPIIQIKRETRPSYIIIHTIPFHCQDSHSTSGYRSPNYKNSSVLEHWKLKSIRSFHCW